MSTTQQAPSGLKVGGTDAIHDVIHASNGGSPIRENLNGTLTLRYDGQKDGYVSAKSASRKVTFANQGDTKVGGFTPSDLGMKHWQEGTYWLDLDVPKQGGMKAAINTPDREPSETFRVPAVPPTKVTKTIEKGTSADSMVNRTTIVAPTGRCGYAPSTAGTSPRQHAPHADAQHRHALPAVRRPCRRPVPVTAATGAGE